MPAVRVATAVVTAVMVAVMVAAVVMRMAIGLAIAAGAAAYHDERDNRRVHRLLNDILRWRGDGLRRRGLRRLQPRAQLGDFELELLDATQRGELLRGRALRRGRRLLRGRGRHAVSARAFRARRIPENGPAVAIDAMKNVGVRGAGEEEETQTGHC